MYVGIDVGGTKTLVAALDTDGVIKKKTRFQTDEDYYLFLENLRKAIDSFKLQEYEAGAIGIPATHIDRVHGRAISFGNLKWQSVPIQHDIEQLCKCPIVVENDAKLAALSESMLLKNRYKVVLYITVSTGIGYGLVNNGVIDTSIGDGGGRTIILEHRGQLMPWEDFASGRAIFERYGKKAKDITDQSAWKAISRDLAKGLVHLIAITQPEVIVIGGGVGNYFEHFRDYLNQDIEKYKIPLVKLPAILEAQRPEEAVLFGCYDIAKQTYPHGKDNN